MRKFPELSINMASLVTTVVENIHAVSRMKHETFTVLEYAQDFSNIMKESLKPSTAWSIKYFSNPKTYYRLPSTPAALHDIRLMKASQPNHTLPQDDICMKEWVERFNSVRQRTVRQETT